MGRARRAEDHADVGARQAAGGAVGRAAKLPRLRLKVAVHPVCQPAIPVGERFAEIVGEGRLIMLERGGIGIARAKPVPGSAKIGEDIRDARGGKDAQPGAGGSRGHEWTFSQAAACTVRTT